MRRLTMFAASVALALGVIGAAAPVASAHGTCTEVRATIEHFTDGSGYHYAQGEVWCNTIHTYTWVRTRFQRRPLGTTYAWNDIEDWGTGYPDDWHALSSSYPTRIHLLACGWEYRAKASGWQESGTGVTHNDIGPDVSATRPGDC